LVRDVIPASSVDNVLNHYREAVRSGRTVRWEQVSVYPVGRKVGEVAVTPLDDGGRPSQLIGFVRDITTEDRLREENERKNEFLAMLSHELRNPLAAIRNALAVLDPSAAHEQADRDAREIIERQVRHLTAIVDDLVDIARITSAKTALTREVLSVSALLRRTIDDHRPDFEKHGVACDVLVMEDLWVDGDRTRLVQVFGNLLNNAVKFTPSGGRVTISLEREGDSAVVRVRDTGVGIEADVLQKLFVPFVQASQPLDRAAGGLGLGLALSKGLVELHGGTIAAASAGRDTGTELIVRLPLASAPARSAPPTATTHAATPRRLLVIEDNVDVANGLRVVLALRGHTVWVAYDGASGLAMAREFRPDIVICDLGLPHMSGYDVARALRVDKVTAEPLLVAFSGYVTQADRERSASAGFQRHLPKPVELQDLDDLIASAPAVAPTEEPS
jgi:two-component system CheB/CheR fusion protein